MYTYLQTIENEADWVYEAMYCLDQLMDIAKNVNHAEGSDVVKSKDVRVQHFTADERKVLFEVCWRLFLAL